MAEQRQYRLRALYCKQGRLVMLSHLEVAEALRRAVRRADLPFAVSQGFSPHMKMTFSAALPVGVGSTSEIFDLMLTEYVPAAQAFQALQRASVPDLMVVACAYVDNKAKAASVAFPVSHYCARFDGPVDGFELVEQLTVARANKKPKTQVLADYLRGPVEKDGFEVRFALEALANGSLRPDNLLSASLEAYNRDSSHPLRLVSCTRVDQCDTEGGSLLALMGKA